MAILSIVFFSCPKGGSSDSGYVDCFLTINYKYNNPRTQSVESASIDIISYKGENITSNLNLLSDGKWKEYRELGYGYYDNQLNKSFYFKPNDDGYYEFLTESGDIWTTGDVLPAGKFVLTPKYVSESNDCQVYIHYKNNSDIYTAVNIKVPYGTILIDYKRGTPEGWTDGEWTPNPQNGRYQYTYAGSTYYVDSVEYGNGKRKYLFTTTPDGAVEYDVTKPITEASLNLYPKYIDDTYIQITIKYNYADEDFNLKEGSFTCSVRNYTTLADHFGSSEPKDWHEKNFTTSFGGRGANYEFLINTDDKNIKNAKVGDFVTKRSLRKEPGGYVFVDSDNKKVLTSTKLDKKTTLVAQYDDSSVKVDKKLVFTQYVNYDDTSLNYYENTFTEIFYSDSGITKYNLDMDSLLVLHDDGTAEDRLFYGYVDYRYYDNPAYYYNKESNGTYKLSCTDGSGTTKIITNNIDLNTIVREAKLTPLYTPAGRWPVKMHICPGVDLRFVFLPYSGSHLNAGWPYSQKTPAGQEWTDEVKNAKYTDDIDATGDNAVYELFFGQFLLNQDDVAKIIAAGEELGLGYKFSNKAISTSYGLKYKNEQNYPWNYVTYYDAMAFCNLLTELYNINNIAKKIDYYDYAYVIKNGTVNVPLKDVTQFGNGAITYVGWKVKYWSSNILFRLPDLCEWEYASRVITDERQVPSNKTYLISPNDNSNPAIWFYYRKTGNETSTYLSSGAGLAYYDSSTKTYNPSRLRKGAEAIGRSGKSNILLRQKVDSSGKLNNNMKNGAGIFNMHGTLRQYTTSAFSADSGAIKGQIVVKGGNFNLEPADAENKIGGLSNTPKADASDDQLSKVGLRVVFNPDDITRYGL